MPGDNEWHRLFDKPIELPDGAEIRSLLDAGHYIAALPKATQERLECIAPARAALRGAMEGEDIGV
jgi:hypothetical protein